MRFACSVYVTESRMTWGRRIRRGKKTQVGATHILEEDLENTTGLLVDEARDTLDTTSAGKTTDSGLGDTWTHRGQEKAYRNAQVHTPWMLSRRILRWRLAPPLPSPFPPFPRPDMFIGVGGGGGGGVSVVVVVVDVED